MIIIKNNKTYNVEYNEGVTYNKQVKYTESPTPTIADNEIKYTSTNNQKINDFNTSGLTILSHTFENGVGSILLDPTTLNLPKNFAKSSPIDTVEMGANIKLDNEYVFNTENSLNPPLRSVILPANLTNIGERCFRHRFQMTTLDIPAGVTNIGIYLLWQLNYNNVQYIVCRPTTPPTIYLKTFIVKFPNDRLTTDNFVPIVYVPAASVTAYQTAPVWSNYYAAGMQILPIP